jgi:hypothetical protein
VALDPGVAISRMAAPVCRRDVAGLRHRNEVSSAGMTTESGTKIYTLARYERPVCEECRKQMWLTSIKPGDLGLEVRTYECSACAASKTLLVRQD